MKVNISNAEAVGHKMPFHGHRKISTLDPTIGIFLYSGKLTRIITNTLHSDVLGEGQNNPMRYY